MKDPDHLSRREWLKLLGVGGAGVALGELLPPEPGRPFPQRQAPNVAWNSSGPLVAYPQKLPLIVLTDRPVQLETPRDYFASPFTPNAAFFVRWHLDQHPNAIDLSRWRLEVGGQVRRVLSLSFDDLVSKYPAVTVAAVNQCSGNSRSRLQPRVPGGQWGNGAMGNAVWTGARLSSLLEAAEVQPGAVAVQFEGLDRGRGPIGKGSHSFLKSLNLDEPALHDSLVAYAMNGEPLPMLNGFPIRLVVPGWFATYWVKALTWIRVLDQPDDNFWMKSAYRIPDTPRGSTTPDSARAGAVRMIPIHRMPVRSFLISPDGNAKLPAGLPVTVRGIAFSGYGRLGKVEISEDDGHSWRDAELGTDHGPYAFRTWEAAWTPRETGVATLAVRATDEGGNMQPDEGVWNPGGYLWNRIERQSIVVGGGGRL